MDNIIDSLSPIERKIVPYLNSSIENIIEKSKLDRVSVIRALQFLQNKNLVKIIEKKQTVIDLGVNGVYYLKNHLPERKLLTILEENNYIKIEDAQKVSKLTSNEFKAALGALKKKAIISLKDEKISVSASKEDITKKFPEEKLLESLPRELISLTDEEKYSLETLKQRKEIVQIEEKKEVSFNLTSEGKKIAGKKIELDFIEEITSEIIKEGVKGKKFRKYDIQAQVPKISGGREHFVNQSIEYGKRIWLEMGFKEMSGKLTETSFWNFDALFTAQDHPVREMHDTFFIKGLSGKLPEKSITNKIKEVHEKGVGKSKGWRYNWSEENAKKVILRTHTTCLSARALSKIRKNDFPQKLFSIGKVFRNETLDWSHGFEFNQSEGIVIDPNANFRHLIGYLKEFASKMGYEKIRIQPAYFPYTEPSVEGAVWNENKKEWVEVLAAGIFRPEVTLPLLGIDVPVLAWGPGFDRLMMKALQINDLRELYKNDLNVLKSKRYLIR